MSLSTMKAVVFDQAGKAPQVLQVRQVPVPQPQAGEVLVRVQARPLQPADFMFIEGRYRLKPVFPQVAGLEGCGEVVQAGEGVPLAVGTQVAFRSPGTWAEYVCVPAAKLFAVPAGVQAESASQFSLNPVTAWGLLDEAGAVAGDTLAVNAATSGVAQLVAALARRRGIKVVGIVRSAGEALPFPTVLAGAEDLAAQLQARAEGQLLAGLLDSVGGEAITRVLPALRQGATVVSYGVLQPEPARIGNPDMIYRNLCWKGFGVDWWLSRSQARHAQMAGELWSAIAGGELPLPVKSRHALDDVQSAVASAQGAGGGKVLLTG